LLVGVAKADQASAFQEVEQIDRLLTKRFTLNPLQAAKMRASRERLDEKMPERRR
jgi:hypothetical protein